MDTFRIEDMKKGWFVGNFTPVAFRSKDFEIGYVQHGRGEKWPVHYHKIATEINFLVKGKMTIQGKELKTGDIFVIYPSEVANPIFLEDCEVVVIKTPSVPGDRYEVADATGI